MKLKLNNQVIRDDQSPVKKTVETAQEAKEAKTIPPLDVSREEAFLLENELVSHFRAQRGGTIRCDVTYTTGEPLCWGRGFDQTRALRNAMKDIITSQDESVQYENLSMPQITEEFLSDNNIATNEPSLVSREFESAQATVRRQFESAQAMRHPIEKQYFDSSQPAGLVKLSLEEVLQRTVREIVREELRSVLSKLLN